MIRYHFPNLPIVVKSVKSPIWGLSSKSIIYQEGRWAIQTDGDVGNFSTGLIKIDASGRLLIPSFTDFRSSYLWKILFPRKDVIFPIYQSIIYAEQYLLQLGITQVFHHLLAVKEGTDILLKSGNFVANTILKSMVSIYKQGDFAINHGLHVQVNRDSIAIEDVMILLRDIGIDVKEVTYINSTSDKVIILIPLISEDGHIVAHILDEDLLRSDRSNNFCLPCGDFAPHVIMKRFQIESKTTISWSKLFALFWPFWLNRFQYNDMRILNQRGFVILDTGETNPHQISLITNKCVLLSRFAVTNL